VKRTDQQNKALHLWFHQLAKSLNDEGYSIQHVLSKKTVDVPWTDTAVKEILWRPLQEIMVGEESTAQADSGDYTKVYETINRHLSTLFGVHVPFPSMESLAEKRQGGGNL